MTDIDDEGRKAELDAKQQLLAQRDIDDIQFVMGSGIKLLSFGWFELVFLRRSFWLLLFVIRLFLFWLITISRFFFLRFVTFSA